MGRDVANFFDRASASYGKRPAGFRGRHEEIGRRLDRELEGDVISIGGPWMSILDSYDFSLTLIDISVKMLQNAGGLPAVKIVADAAQLPIRDERFDHVVLPLILHHLTRSSHHETLELVRSTLSRTRDILRPEGTLWISEFAVSESVYLLQRIAAPVTRRALSLLQIPLVIMHTEEVYRSILNELGFCEVRIDQIRAPEESPWDAITPIIGIDWIVIPRLAYPVRNILIRARKP